VALQHDMHKLVLINHLINLSHSIQRDKVCLPRAPNNNQSSDEVLARGGVDDAKFTSTQSFSPFRLDTFCPSVRTKCRSENQTDADTGFQHLLLPPPPPPPSVEFGLSAAPSVSAQEKIQLDW